MGGAPPSWAHRLALITAGATLLLIVAGGLVTNTGAALAVPDWPTTFGQNMFLYPWSQMVGGVLYEHSHRLLGAMVGLLTLGLAATLWVTERRSWLRALGLGAVALVCAQGLLGGLRVLLLRETLAIVHGCVAQAFFAATVVLAVCTSSRWRAAPAPFAARDARRVWRLSVAASGALYLQIVLGALTAHAGWVGPHVAGAVVAGVVTLAAGLHVLDRHGACPALAWAARVLGLLLAVQVALGLGAYVARLTDQALPGGAPVGLALPVAHRAVASLLLGAAVALTAEGWRLYRAGLVDTHVGVGAGALSPRVPA